MDIEKYIASGILEQYALGNTTAEESREVEANVLQYPEIAEELDIIQASLEQLAFSEARVVRPGLEAELMEKVGKDPIPEKDPPSKNSPFNGKAFPGFLIGALLLAIGALGYQSAQSNKAQQALNEALDQSQAELEQLKIDCAALKDTTTTLINYANVVGDPNSQQVAMSGQAIAPASFASVYWNEAAQKSYLEIKNLPPPPAGSQYQLWAIVDGVPVDMGVFDLAFGPTSLKEVPYIENPQSFAVTLEKEGGSPTPNLEQLYVIGNLS